MSSMTLTCAVCHEAMQQSRTSAPQGKAAHAACKRSVGNGYRNIKDGHGSSGYHKGCRCEICREGQRLAMAAYAAKVKERDGISPSARLRREQRGVDPAFYPDCLACGEKLKMSARTERPMHKACRSAAPQWMRDGLPKPEPRRPKPKPKPRGDLRSKIRRGIEDGLPDLVLEGVLDESKITEGGCWEWQGMIKGGYAVRQIAKKYTFIHRISLEAKMGAPLGGIAAHHICANSRCVNPDHLIPVTHRENTIEMLARNSLEARIFELEAALLAVDPMNPALSLIPAVKSA